MTDTAYVSAGDNADFAKTITESDLAMFCAISGDFDPIHVDEERARQSIFGHRIAHGILSMALLSSVSAMISRRAVERGYRGTSVSMGYDRIRFLKPVYIGDTLRAHYEVLEVDPMRSRSRSRVEVRNQRDDLVVAGEHLMKWLPPAGPASITA
jgi:acyl dehydratase